MAAMNTRVTRITSVLRDYWIDWTNVRQHRLEGISSRYWTTSDTRSRGFVSSGSSILLPSAPYGRLSHREGANARSIADSVSLTATEEYHIFVAVCQTSRQLVADLQDNEDPGPTIRGLSYLAANAS